MTLDGIPGQGQTPDMGLHQDCSLGATWFSLFIHGLAQLGLLCLMLGLHSTECVQRHWSIADDLCLLAASPGQLQVAGITCCSCWLWYAISEVQRQHARPVQAVSMQQLS